MFEEDEKLLCVRDVSLSNRNPTLLEVSSLKFSVKMDNVFQFGHTVNRKKYLKLINLVWLCLKEQ